MKRLPGTSLMAAIVMAGPASAALQAENLLTPAPPGFKVGSQGSQGPMQAQELVPEGQTVDAWSTMITIQIHHNLQNVDPEAFASALAGRWKSACPMSDAARSMGGVENGFPVSIWLFLCPSNPQTRKPENMFMKVIGGADALYVVQYAYRRPMTKDLVGPAMAYLRDVKACDTRRSDRPCPAGS